MEHSESSFAADSSGPQLSASWIRESSTQTVDTEQPSSSDIIIAQLAVIGLWMGRKCREITNNTDAIFRTDTQVDSGGLVGQGYSASILDASHTMMVNNTSKYGTFVVRKHVRSWGLDGRSTGIDFVREIRVLTHEAIRKSPNIVSLISFEWMFWPGEEPSLSPQMCLERSELGDLASFQRAHSLSYQDKRKIFLDIAHGLVALHDSGVVHGDIKSENVLIFENEGIYQAKICDFGFAVLLVDIKGEKARLLGGTSPWTAPEFRRELPYPHHFLKLTDVYSLGLLIWRVLLDGANPFEHALLKSIASTDEAKDGNLPLLHYAQASIILRTEYSSFIDEIWSLLACTIQKNPLKRKLRTVIRTITNEPRPMIQTVKQLSSDPLNLAQETFNIRNICLPIRLRMMKHLKSSALQLGHRFQTKPDNLNYSYPVARGVIDVAIGDGGFDLDDDPTEALKWITILADKQSVPMQAIIIRMYDYFDKPWPLELKQKANEYLGNGVVNGSVTAALDYKRYWPSLEFQTHSEPESLFLRNRSFYGNGTGLHLSVKALDIGDIQSLRQNVRSLGEKSPILEQMYGLDSGNTLLHACAMLGLPKVADVLISEFRVDINARNDNGDTPLLAACRNGKFPMVFKLVAKGARADITNANDETPLHWVLNVPDEEFVFQGQSANKLSISIDSLVYAGGNLEARAGAWASRADMFNSLIWIGGTPLHRAVARRNIPAAKALILKGADPTSLDEGGISPLGIAMLQHNAPMLGLLLYSCRLNLNTHDASGHSLYSKALSMGSIFEMIIIHGKEYPNAVADTLDLLIAGGFDITCAKIDRTGGECYKLDALFVAAFYERHLWVQYFLSSKECMRILDINKRQGEHSMTALHQSIHCHRKSTFISLLDAGADPRIKCSTWSIKETNIDMETTSLHLVAQQGDPDLFFTNRLLEYDLEIDAADFYGITPFACAVIEGNLHIANALLERGADINKRTGVRGGKPEHQQTVLASILQRDCILVVNRLKYLVSDLEHVEPALARHGPAADFMVEDSRSALHVFLSVNAGREDAAFRTCLEVLLRAFSLPAQLNSHDDQGRTPLDIAASNDNGTAVKALLSAGATGHNLDLPLSLL